MDGASRWLEAWAANAHTAATTGSRRAARKRNVFMCLPLAKSKRTITPGRQCGPAPDTRTRVWSAATRAGARWMRGGGDSNQGGGVDARPRDQLGELVRQALALGGGATPQRHAAGLVVAKRLEVGTLGQLAARQ